MNIRSLLLCTVIICSVLPVCAGNDGQPADIVEQMKKSCVYLDVSAYAYDNLQPWKPTDVVSKNGYACAVGPYEVLTTAWTVTDTAVIKVKRYGQNEYIPATIKVIDYEYNLCILQLDKNTAGEPLEALKFSTKFNKGTELKSFWLSSGGHFTTGRAYLDRAEVRGSTVSYAQCLNYIATNTSRQTDSAEVYCDNNQPIGIACWENKEETGLIPAETINRFLEGTAGENYTGFATRGFETENLLDPAMRSYLKMPPDLKNGVYVRKVYTLGTGCRELKTGDVILAINGQALNPYGRYEHPLYEKVLLDHLITSNRAGQTIKFEIWRDGAKKDIDATASNFKASDMLIPYYQYGSAPKYLVTGGCIFQQLTRNYFKLFGEDFAGRTPPHLFNYYRQSFEPQDNRREIVILSYVLPNDINLGYQDLRSVVVDKVNGMKINRLKDILDAKKLNPDSKFDIIEFEMDYPALVLPRQQLPQADAAIEQLYRVKAPMRMEN